jgi:hypothetical protein
MTPLIAEMVRITPDPEAGYWFDLGEVPETIEFVLNPELMVHLPYDVVFVVAKAQRRRVLVKATFQHESVGVAGFVFADTMIDIKPFVYTEKDAGIGVYPEGATKHQTTMMALGVIQTLLGRLEAPQTAYMPVARQSFTSRRKVAQGKKPSYDWRTVTVLPQREPSEPQGGTHASPREHDRRGHWRTLKTKRVWVRPCKVGNPAQGKVFHDYKVPDET